MAEEDLDDELEEGDEEDLDEEGEGEDGEDGDAPKKGRKKLMLIVGLALFLVVGGTAGAWFMGFLDPVLAMLGMGATEEEVVDGEAGPIVSQEAVFYDLPELLVNLNTGGRKSTFLKIRISLELASVEDVTRIEQMMPRIIDNFQVYLRELRVEDLKGSAGVYRLREELLTRVSAAVAPAEVNDVLFKEMLVQ